MSNEGKSKYIYSKLAINPVPWPREDRSKWHLKNVAKQKAYGTWKVNSTEQRLDVKRRCEEFDRANQFTEEDFIALIRKMLDDEREWLNRKRA